MPGWDEIEPHVPSLFRYLLRLTRDFHQAEDLTQEAVLKVWKHRRKLKDVRKLKVWMLRIARNLTFDEHRQQQRRPAQEAGLEGLADPWILPPEQAAILTEEEQNIRTLVDSLPGQQREVLHLTAAEGLTLAQIAEVLNITRNSAKVSLCTARKRVREALFPVREVSEQKNES